MNRAEINALDDWSVEIVKTHAEAPGKDLGGVKSHPFRAPYESDTVGYSPRLIREAFLKHVPESLVNKLESVLRLPHVRSYREVWPYLDDFDVGTLMKAGAVHHLKYEDE